MQRVVLIVRRYFPIHTRGLKRRDICILDNAGKNGPWRWDNIFSCCDRAASRRISLLSPFRSARTALSNWDNFSYILAGANQISPTCSRSEIEAHQSVQTGQLPWLIVTCARNAVGSGRNSSAAQVKLLWRATASSYLQLM